MKKPSFHSFMVFSFGPGILIGNSIARYRAGEEFKAVYVPAVIKLDCLERFLFTPSSTHSEWAKTLYLLGSTMNELPGVEVAGVAPDFGDWYVCFYLSYSTEEENLDTIRRALRSGGGAPQDCRVVQKAREFGRKNGHRRAIMRIRPEKAVLVAESLHQALPKPLALSLAG